MLVGLVTVLFAGVTAVCGCKGAAEGPTASNPVPVALIAAPESTVVVVPNAIVGVSTTMAVHLRDRLGQPFTSDSESVVVRIAGVNGGPDSSLVAGYVSGSEYAASQVPTSVGVDTVTVLVNGESVGSLFRSVTMPNVGEPVYDPANPDHLLHVFEDWSNLTRIADLPTTPRADGGPAWVNAGILIYGAVVDSSDGFGSRRFVTSDYRTDPPIPPHGTGIHAAGYHWFGGGSPANGFQGDARDPQGDDNAIGAGKNNRGLRVPGTGYLNKPTRDAVVFEWAVRQRGSNWYGGKNVDINGGFGSGFGRWDFDPFDPKLGGAVTRTCTEDPICSTYYDDDGVPRYPGVPPSPQYLGPSFSRSQNIDLPGVYPIASTVTLYVKQNTGWGTGPGQFSWGSAQLHPVGEKNADLSGRGRAMWEAGWLYFKFRATREPPTAPYVYGRGRIEFWIGTMPGSLVKVMEYLGDVGQRDEGLVYIDPTGSSDLLPSAISFYSLLSRQYTGGAIVDLGTVRVWSHSRQ
jgi:hypothetical protein